MPGFVRVRVRVRVNDYWESISKAPPIPEPTPFLAIVVRGGHRETTTSNARLLVVVCGFIVGFISFIAIFLLRAVLVDLINDREPDATDCRRAMTSSKLLVPSFLRMQLHKPCCIPPC